MMVSISDLRHRVRLEQAVRMGDGGGGANVVWESVGEFWAAIYPRGSSEADEADALRASVRHDIYCHYRADAAPHQRIVFGTRIFDIRSVVTVDEARRFLKLDCVETVT